jgi:hypothetical protein
MTPYLVNAQRFLVFNGLPTMLILWLMGAKKIDQEQFWCTNAQQEIQLFLFVLYVWVYPMYKAYSTCREL